jgi:hypothetical protein
MSSEILSTFIASKADFLNNQMDFHHLKSGKECLAFIWFHDKTKKNYPLKHGPFGAW